MVAQPGSLIRIRCTENDGRFAPDHQGTLGCFVRRENQSGLFFLFAANVAALNGRLSQDNAIEFKEGERWTEFARFIEFAHFAPAYGLQVTDAAIARVTREDLVSARLKEWNILPASPVCYPRSGDNVRLYSPVCGGLIDARIHRTDGSLPLIYRGFNGSAPSRLDFRNQIFYGREQNGELISVTAGSDCGALVMDERGAAVGLHIAKTTDHDPVDASICAPIDSILERFQASLVVKDVRSSLSVTVNKRERPPGALPFTLDRIVVSPEEMASRIAEVSTDLIGESVWWMCKSHQYYVDGVSWRMSKEGLVIDGKVDRTDGKPLTVGRVWKRFGRFVTRSAGEYAVPAELIVATICMESGGHPGRVHIEPGFISAEETPSRIFAGAMRTRLSTARELLGADITDRDLLDPEISIKAGAACINNQRGMTRLDPPLVACAYSTGRVIYHNSKHNRWKMRQYPVGTGAYADRFTQWFNDCIAYFGMLAEGRAPVALKGAPVPATSFYNILRLTPSGE